MPAISSRKNLVRALLFAAIGVLVVLSARGIKQAELLRHGGKSIAQWFDTAVLDDMPGCAMSPRDFEARKVIIEFGSQGIPFLLKKAQEKPSRIAGVCDKVLGRLPMSLMLRLPISRNYRIPMQRSTAISILGEIVRQQSDKDSIKQISPENYDATWHCLTVCSHTNETVEIRTKAIQALACVPKRSSD